MYPTELGAIDWEVNDFRGIIININNMDFQPSQLPPIFITFNTIDTKKPRGPCNNGPANSVQEKNQEKEDDPKFNMNPRLVNGNSETTKS